MTKRTLATLFVLSYSAHFACASYQNDFYAGVGAGGGILEANLTNQQILNSAPSDPVDFIKDKKQYATNVDGSVLLGWKQRRQNAVFGVDGSIGWGFQTEKVTGRSPLPVTPSTTLVSKLGRGFNLSAMGFLGYGCGPWTGALKAGFVGANFTHNLKEFDGSTLVDERTQHHFSPALGLGGFVDRSLGNMTLRLDYTCALHESFDQNFLSGGDTTNVQEIKSPVMHRVMAGVLWKL